MENQLMVLPAEVAQIAEKVSVEKRSEVQLVLNHVFNGVSKMRQQLESVVVVDPNDRVNMKLANTIRLGVREVRLNAEKTFDAKRYEVQQQMLSYKTEDALWLKAKQTMQILTKEIEESARWKEETLQRFETEQKELKIQERVNKIMPFNPEITRNEIEYMSDEMFNVFHAGIEKQYNDRIEAEKLAEAERVAKEKAEAEERERIRKENEMLKIEAEKKAKELEKERAKTEAERRALEEKARKERAEADAKLKAERDAREKIEKEMRAKAEAEAKAKRDDEARLLAEQKAKELAAKKALTAPDKDKLNKLAVEIDSIQLPDLKTPDAMRINENIKDLLTKVSKYIRENAEKLST